MHNRPGMSVGKFGMRPGSAMAGGALFDIIVKGNGSHGARPESGIDPVIISAHIATAAQTIVSRNANPQEMAVLSITQIQSGDAYNVIPHTAHMKGTARTFSNEIMKLLETNLTKIAKSIAEGMGATAEVDFRVTFPPLINNKDEIMKPTITALVNAFKNISRCSFCGSLKSKDSGCNNCENISKKYSKICVVENIADQWSIENSNVFQGYFHILGGTISSVGQRKEDLLINSLVERVKKEKIDEIILATSATVEGLSLIHI